MRTVSCYKREDSEPVIVRRRADRVYEAAEDAAPDHVSAAGVDGQAAPSRGEVEGEHQEKIREQKEVWLLRE
jgi:hypothetical protein